MKKSLLFIVLTLMGMSLMAKPVDPTIAVRVAQNFAATQVKMADNTAKIVYTHPMPESGQPAMYVVNVGSSAFVIVAADDIAHPVLGYSMARPWPVLNGERRSENGEPNATEGSERASLENGEPNATEGSERASLENGERAAAIQLPSQVSGFLDDLASQIRAAQQQDITQDRETATEWQRLLSSEYNLYNSQLDLPDSVGPLLTTTWDQGQYYNALCPEDTDGPDGHAVTGCVATAMAQIINYWGYPVHGRGTHSYNHNTYGTLSVNYDSAIYDYANMPSVLTATSTPQEVQAVAQLMRDCGVAVTMDYGAYESGADGTVVASALVNYFRMNSKLGETNSSFFSGEQWLDMLRTSISLNMPVLYSNVSHEYVIDGYNSDGFFHVNNGWNGYADGWYILDTLYTYSAIFDIYPDSMSNIIIGQSYGNSSFIVDSNINFKYVYAENNLPHSQNTGGAHPQIVTFSIDDTTEQIVIDFMSFDLETPMLWMEFYDGGDTSAPLIRTIAHYIYGQSDLSPIVGSSNQITIHYACVHVDAGFHLRIGRNGDCRMVSNITIKEMLDTKEMSWKENGLATEWKVEYGLEGFDVGTGTSHIVDTNHIVLTGLANDSVYEIRVCPVCNDSTLNLWRSLIVNKRKYWMDIVVNEHEGYQIDSLGTIHIMSPYGLAWLAQQADNYFEGKHLYCRDVVFDSDIDLGSLLWRPIERWEGNINGNGHIIRNMTIKELSKNGGLFTYIMSDTIRDLGFVNANINAANAGTIAYSSEPSTIVQNCYSMDFVIQSTQFDAGGLFAINHSTIENSYSVGRLMPSFIGGGIVGDGGPTMNNCYSSIRDINGQFTWKGLLVGYTRSGSFNNCFADTRYIQNTWSNDNLNMGFFFGYLGDIQSVENVAGFNDNGHSIVSLDTSFCINCTYLNGATLLNALNCWVSERNSSSMRTWVWDSVMQLPVFGDYYVPICPNVSDITIENIKKDEGYAVVISWQENGNNDEWQIKCVPVADTSLPTIVYNTTSMVDTLVGLHLGSKYQFYVRSVCEIDSVEHWGSPVVFVVDKPYWTDIVTTQPEGYIEDVNGIITITSAEGLAWLSVCSNGLNGQPRRNYSGAIIYLESDIDLIDYKWMPISMNDMIDSAFHGTVYGKNKEISNLYINEIDASWCALFGYAVNATLKDILLTNCDVTGYYVVGGLVGCALGCVIDNCHTNGSIRGVQNVGGLIGQLGTGNNNGRMINSSSKGDVYGNRLTGGLVGFQESSSIVNNCYSSCNIYKGTGGQFEWVGGLIGGSGGVVNNCYSIGQTEIMSDLYGNLTSSGSVFMLYPDVIVRNIYSVVQANGLPMIGNDTWGSHIVADTSTIYNNGSLLTNVTIGGDSYLALLSALNAWVDENNTDGQYFHWRSDTANINGGFPVFEVPPCLIVPRTFKEPFITACDSYTFSGVTYIESVAINDTIQTANGCDSISSQLIIISHPVQAFENVKVCEGQSYTFNGKTLTETGYYYDTIINGAASGCDSIVGLWLEVRNPTSWHYPRVCEGESYTFNGRTLTETNWYYDTIANGAANGCDSIVSLWLEVQNPTSWHYPRVCEGESYTFNGRTLTETGYYYDTIINGAANGCDSIVSLWLEVQNPTSWQNARVCEGQSYTFNGRTLMETNWYYDTIINGATNGCDSIVYLWLEVQNPTSWHNARVCEGQSYTFNGRTLTETNNYYDTIFNGAANGCDSIVYLWLEVRNNYSYPSAEICQGESYSFAGQMLTESGTYFDTLTNMSANGCDSIVQLSFTVHPTNNQHDTIYLPANSLPYLYTYQDWTQDVDDFSVTMNSNTQIIDTRVNPAGTIYDNGGPNGNYSDYFDGTIILTADEGETIKLSGNYQLEGCCDHIAVYDGYGVSGNCLLYTCGGGSVDVQTSTGYLTLRFTSDGSVNFDGFTLQWNTRHTIDTMLTATGDYTFEAHTSYGCNNTFNLHLEQRTAYSRTDSMTVCSNTMPYAYADTLIADAGTYTFTYLDRYGIDSTVTLHLTVNQSTTGDTTAVACDSFMWWNTNYTNSTNEATHTLTNAAGCDSVVTLHLTINNPVHTATTEAACETYTWNGTAYTVSGDYTYVHADNNGCTQVDTLHLTVNHSTTGDTAAVACDSFIWWNTNCTNSTNEATHTLTNAAGCDSVVTLHLTINHSTTGVDVQTACDSYTWIDGNTYTESNFNSQFSILNSLGCDSTVTLNLTINHSVTFYDTLTIDSNELPYDYYGNSIDGQGNFTFEGTTSEGCDSTTHLFVIVNQVGIGDVQTADGITIFPNPTSGMLTIRGNGLKRVEVMDVVGRTMLVVECQRDSERIDLSDLPQGTYVVRIIAENGIAVRRVVKR